jgi:Ca2+-binding EF-hand superfamily protein
MRHISILSTIIASALFVPIMARAADPPTAKEAKKGDAVQRILAKFDKNGDGALQLDELAALVAAHDKHMAEAGKVDKAKPKLTAEELMKKFDANGDGKLEPSEIETMVKELHPHREKANQPATP